MITDQKNSTAQLSRRLNLPLLTLYGLGVTIGAGIYVLIGATAAKAGMFTPISFLIAAIVVAFTAFSYAELGTRYPVSAGEAAYVNKAFTTTWLSVLVGLMVIASGVVSSAAISIGAAAYLQHFVDLPDWVLVSAIILFLGLVTFWGILESVTLAAIFTLIEVGGLFFVIYYGLEMPSPEGKQFIDLIPVMDSQVWTGIAAASLLAFFAFVGFEDIANVVEEVKNPVKTLPSAIILTLVISTALYLAVVSVVVLSVPMEKLSKSVAPLSLLFENAGPATRNTFIVIAIIATVNGVLIQMIMASRVLYGLGSQGSLPKVFAHINQVTHTPIVATVVVVGIVLALANFFPVAELAKTTSKIVLVIFVLVNASLLRVKWLNKDQEERFFRVPVWVPVVGILLSIAMLAAGFL